MPGPNSAPNGDAGLVVGYPGEEFVWSYRYNKVVPKRLVVKTGKTDKKRG